MLIYTTASLADYWQCSPDAVLALLHSHKLAGFSVSPPGSKRPRYRFTAQAVADYEAGKRPQPEAPPAKKAKRPNNQNVIQFYK